MKTTITLICPNGCAPVISYRTGARPCLQCAIEGRGVVQRTGHSDAPPARPPRQLPDEREAPTVVAFKWDCAKFGHVYVGAEPCGHCGDPQPADPAAGRLVVTIVALALALQSCAGLKWKAPTVDESGLAGVAAALVAVDAAQTCALLDEPGRWEVNPLLGRHPSCAKISGAAAASLVALGLGWWFLPPPWRDAVSLGVVFVEVPNDAHNAALAAGWRW